MPISYALLLGIPIGIFFYFLARMLLRVLMGHFESPERRASMAFGAFGLLLIPTIWMIGVLGADLSAMGKMVLSYGTCGGEVLILTVLVQRFYAHRDGSD